MKNSKETYIVHFTYFLFNNFGYSTVNQKKMEKVIIFK